MIEFGLFDGYRIDEVRVYLDWGLQPRSPWRDSIEYTTVRPRVRMWLKEVSDDDWLTPGLAGEEGAIVWSSTIGNNGGATRIQDVANVHLPFDICHVILTTSY